MKIVDSCGESKKKTTFSDISVGTAFILHGKTYIKVKEIIDLRDQFKRNALQLDDATLYNVTSSDVIVVLVDAKFVRGI